MSNNSYLFTTICSLLCIPQVGMQYHIFQSFSLGILSLIRYLPTEIVKIMKEPPVHLKSVSNVLHERCVFSQLHLNPQKFLLRFSSRVRQVILDRFIPIIEILNYLLRVRSSGLDSRESIIQGDGFDSLQVQEQDFLVLLSSCLPHDVQMQNSHCQIKYSVNCCAY